MMTVVLCGAAVGCFKDYRDDNGWLVPIDSAQRRHAARRRNFEVRAVDMTCKCRIVIGNSVMSHRNSPRGDVAPSETQSHLGRSRGHRALHIRCSCLGLLARPSQTTTSCLDLSTHCSFSLYIPSTIMATTTKKPGFSIPGVSDEVFVVKKGGLSQAQAMTAYLGGSMFQTICDNPITAYR